MELEFVTLRGPKLQSKVYEVILPTPEGAIAIYGGHMPLVTTVSPGVIKVRQNKTDLDEQTEIFATNGGVAEITVSTMRLLVDEAEQAEELVEEEVRSALEQAKRLKQDAKDEIELERAEALIDRQAVRLQVAELKRRRRS